MTDFQEQVIHDLAKEYTFNNFDFKNSSPEELLKSYQETCCKLKALLSKQEAEINNSLNKKNS